MSQPQKKTINQCFCRMGLLLALDAIIPVYAANVPDPQELIKQLGIEQQKLASLDKGEAVPFDLTEGTDKELAAGVVMYVPAKPSELVQLVKKNNLGAIDTDIVASGEIKPQAGLDVFKGFGFSAKQAKEADNFLAAKPGDEFNLSTQEIDTIKAITKGDKKAARDAASQAYRNILLQRWHAYRKGGLQGIASYSRDGDAATPAAELRKATTQSKLLERYFPELYKAWLNYPAALPAGVEEQFYWLNRTVEKRPTAILGHRIIMDTGNGALLLARQYYVGHSYNSNQLSVACLPYRDGSLIVYANRNSTDQVAGMGSSLKHSIGREQVRAEIIKRLKKIKQLVKAR